MASVIYRCPTTGKNVQAWFDDDISIYAETRQLFDFKEHVRGGYLRSVPEAAKLCPELGSGIQRMQRELSLRYLQPVLAFAEDTARQLAGSWKLNSWTIQVIGGEVTEPFGPNPKGRAVFTPGGYVAFVIAAANRKPAANDEESAALLKTLLAYTGKFTIDGDKVYYQGRHIVE